ncbi:hypothetical protein A7P96_07335 [Eikenella sp. NML03-A-027]|uniref:hypothetical protein n=1 Tax=Eikenella sp. NML03-A-027 TaxID=1795828 RepID=UPI0007E13C4B|nr:hypothetical protein [Eikenella sp. NML03-A-027]OAM30404.1 hypothetical protein A7P96_07335 [Eikenella sp. NML03-A-027]
MVSGCALHSLFITFGDNSVQSVGWRYANGIWAFGFTMGGGVGELLEVEHAAELVEAADGGTALTVLPFGQAGVGQCF